MPVRTSLSRKTTPSESDLQAELEAELRAPKDAGEPDIVIEEPHRQTVHIFVTWSKFDGIDPAVRSSIIMDSFAAVKGVDEAQKITVAMGMTPVEASRLGLE
jgi:hypothetical protein